MDTLERLKLRTGEADESILTDCLESAASIIQARRYPFGNWPDELEPQYVDLQYRIALDLYNKDGAEGELSHSENGVSRSYESSWVSEQLLREIVPKVGGLT
jgi:hypothetical protein